MSETERKKYLQDLKHFTDTVTASKEEAKNFLVESGICTKKGKLTVAYRTPKKTT